MSKRISETQVINQREAVASIQRWEYPIEDRRSLDPLFELIGDARVVMLGEASYGTDEYYNWRNYISRRLIEEKGFDFIAAEGDWPDCYHLNRYAKNYIEEGKGAYKILHEVNRWPTWMLANWEVVSFADWLRDHNRRLPSIDKVGFYGLDVYSLWESLDHITRYLKKVDPAAVGIAEKAFRCFEPYCAHDIHLCAKVTSLVPGSWQSEVTDLLREIRSRIPHYNSDHENSFCLGQNALVAIDAEAYYRSMLKGGPHSWNIREDHMMQTLERLFSFHGPHSKVIVWAHNTHVGDARATDMSSNGMRTLGELARIKYHHEGVVLLGMGSFCGSVIASQQWGAKMQCIQVPEAKEGSWEYILHRAGTNSKLLIMNDFHQDVFMENTIGHRAIGVVYQPQYEKYGNFVPSILPLRYDAFISLDKTTALHPIHIQPDGAQMPKTFPFGV